MAIEIGDTFHTGQICPVEGRYMFDQYLDGTRLPSPTLEEQIIRLNWGETFPPIRSAKKACRWYLASLA